MIEKQWNFLQDLLIINPIANYTKLFNYLHRGISIFNCLLTLHSRLNKGINCIKKCKKLVILQECDRSFTVLFHVILLINAHSWAVDVDFYFHSIVTRLTLIRMRITMRARLHLKRVIAVSKSLHRENTVTMCAIFSWIIATITAMDKGWEEREVKPVVPLWRRRLRRSSRKYFPTEAHSLENGYYHRKQSFNCNLFLSHIAKFGLHRKKAS